MLYPASSLAVRGRIDEDAVAVYLGWRGGVGGREMLNFGVS